MIWGLNTPLTTSHNMATFSHKNSHLTHKTGLLRDSPDHRDFIRTYSEEEIPSTDDHPVVDLRGDVVRVYQQGQLASCTANVACAAYELLVQKQASELNHTYYDFSASRLFVYYNSRKITSTTTRNTGTTMRNALKSMRHWGVCHELLWPYLISEFAKEPTSDCYSNAEGNKLVEFHRLTQNQHQLRACLKEGFPFAFGFNVYDSFELEMEDDGKMPLPSYDEKLDGASEIHGVLCVGYNDNTECFTVLNSWGSDFGDRGYFYMPYKYLLDPEQVFGFWKISKVTESGLNSTLKK